MDETLEFEDGETEKEAIEVVLMLQLLQYPLVI